MATYTCSTSKVAGTSPIVQLTVTTEEHTTYVIAKWKLEYYAQTAASTSVGKSWSVKMGSTTLGSGTYNINGKTGWREIASSGSEGISISKTKAVQTLTFSLSFGFNLTWSGVSMGVKSASTSVKIPIRPSYTITYNANGGSGAPSSQTKWIDEDLTLSTAKPTRTGYTFKGWGTSASTTSSTYAAGATYTANANITLYAVWSIITYTVKYDANGGSGAPANQTKKYGTTLTLSSTVPKKTDYNFLGWSTSVAATTATYDPGDAYTANAAVTLYAVWELAYVKPSIYNLVVYRCTEDGIANDTGTYGHIKFDWKTTKSSPEITLEWTDGELIGHVFREPFGQSGTVDETLSGNFSIDKTYTISIEVKDGADDKYCTVVTATLPGTEFPFDVTVRVDDSDEDITKHNGIAFGKPAELVGVADFAYEAKFNEPVYGKAMGLDKVTAIPAGSNLNNIDYLEPGCYAIYRTDEAREIYCEDGVLMGSSNSVPPAVAGRFEVWSNTGEGVRLTQWSYIRQRFIPYNQTNVVWERTINRGSENVWTYGSWRRSSGQTVLWSGAYYMSGSQTCTLSAPISEQPNGIVLTFSGYTSGTAQNYWFCNFFVPKEAVAKHSGAGHEFIMATNTFGSVAGKYLKISDTQIVGVDTNENIGTASGISYVNNQFVLRYVFGV